MGNKDTGFDFEKALEAIQNGQPLLGKEGILNPLIKQLTEAALEGEIDSHLAQELSVNRRNGKSKRRSNRSTEISNSPRHEIEQGLSPLNWSRNIKQRSVTR